MDRFLPRRILMLLLRRLPPPTLAPPPPPPPFLKKGWSLAYGVAVSVLRTNPSGATYSVSSSTRALSSATSAATAARVVVVVVPLPLRAVGAATAASAPAGERRRLFLVRAAAGSALFRRQSPVRGLRSMSAPLQGSRSFARSSGGTVTHFPSTRIWSGLAHAVVLSFMLFRYISLLPLPPPKKIWRRFFGFKQTATRAQWRSTG